MGLELPVWFEAASLVVLVAILLFDVIKSIRKPEDPSNKSSVIHVVVYATLAVIFGGLIWLASGSGPAIEFYSGWLTEYSLSIDNLFVFVLILANFKVPKKYQKEALGIGILIALILRAIFIGVGAAVIEHFTWIFYVFGAFLIYTAMKLLVDQEGDNEYHENLIVRFFHKIIPMSTRYNGAKLRIPDKNDPSIMRWTPMLIVFISLGVTDLFFAFDSIPAIFGLTRDPFIVLTTNIFALMGLQQLYFLLGSLVERLKFLPLGLAIVLAFIGVKLVLEAMHTFGVNGEGWEWAPEVGTFPSLLVIVITIGVTATASVMKIRYDDRVAAERAARDAERLEREQAHKRCQILRRKIFKLKLKDCKIGEEIIVENIDLNEEYCFRLKEIGITEGVNLQVCQECAFGSKVVSKGTERIGIDSNIAEAMTVRRS